MWCTQWENRWTQDVPVWTAQCQLKAGQHQPHKRSCVVVLRFFGPSPSSPTNFESTSQSFRVDFLMRIIIIIITCIYIYKSPDPREVSSDCPRKKTFSLCGLWLGTHVRTAPHFTLLALLLITRGAEPSAEVSLIPWFWRLSNWITWRGWSFSGVQSIRQHLG